MKKFIAILATVLAFTSCSEHEVKPVSRSGYFTLSSLSRDNGRVKTTREDIPGFDLGNIKASKEFLFLLGNSSEGAIENISLQTNNPQFVISPSHIDMLPGENSQDNVVIPIISLDVMHGIQLDGVGNTDLLTPGENEALITITGFVLIGGVSTEVSTSFTMKVNAKVLDVTLYSDNAIVDYADWVGQWIGSEYESGLPAIPGYDFNPANIKIKNTGNVTIIITLSRLYNHEPIIFGLGAGETSAPLEIPSIFINNVDSYFAQITIDGGGTISDRSRVKLGTDGKGYMILLHEE